MYFCCEIIRHCVEWKREGKMWWFTINETAYFDKNSGTDAVFESSIDWFPGIALVLATENIFRINILMDFA